MTALQVTTPARAAKDRRMMLRSISAARYQAKFDRDACAWLLIDAVTKIVLAGAISRSGLRRKEKPASDGGFFRTMEPLLCNGFSPIQTQNMRIYLRIWDAHGLSDIWPSVRQAYLV
jgi:hypothetical protein